MGIRGLFSFVTGKSVHEHSENGIDYSAWGQPLDLVAHAADVMASGGSAADLTIVVDALIISLSTGLNSTTHMDWATSGQLLDFNTRTRSFLLRLARAGYTVIAVLEGAPAEAKTRRGTRPERWSRRIAATSAFVADGDLTKFRVRHAPALIDPVFVEAVLDAQSDCAAIRESGATTTATGTDGETQVEIPCGMVHILHAANREADDIIADYAIGHGCFAVLGGDTDYFGYPSLMGHIPTDSLVLSGRSGVSAQYMSCADTVDRLRGLVLSHWAAAGEFTAIMLADLATMLSNDHMPLEPLAPFHGRLLEEFRLPPKQLTLAAACFLTVTDLARTADGLLDTANPAFAETFFAGLPPDTVADLVETYTVVRATYVRSVDPPPFFDDDAPHPSYRAASLDGDPVASSYLRRFWEVVSYQTFDCWPVVEAVGSDLYGEFADLRTAMYGALLAQHGLPSEATTVEELVKAPRANAAVARTVEVVPHCPPTMEERLDLLGSLTRAHAAAVQPPPGLVVSGDTLFGGSEAGSATVALTHHQWLSLRTLATLDRRPVLRIDQFDALILALVLGNVIDPASRLRVPPYDLGTRQVDPATLQACTAFSLACYHVFMLNRALGQPLDGLHLCRAYDGPLIYNVAAALAKSGPSGVMNLVAASVETAGVAASAVLAAVSAARRTLYADSPWYAGLAALPLCVALPNAIATGNGAASGPSTSSTPSSGGGSSSLAGDEANPFPFPPEGCPLISDALAAAVGDALGPVPPTADHLVPLNAAIDDFVQSAGGSGPSRWRLFVYGSHALGTATARSDIDVLCVGPPAEVLSMADFFAAVDAGFLQAAYGEVEQAIVQESAFNPLVQLVVGGVEFDLVYAPLDLEKDLPTAPGGGAFADPPSDGDLARVAAAMSRKKWLAKAGRDDVAVRLMRGFRETRLVLDLVADLGPEAVARFTWLARAVKAWQSRRALKGHTFGYMGGLGWAMLAAVTVALFPDVASIDALLGLLFRVMASWPHPAPLALVPPDSIAKTSANGGMMPWRASKARHHRMAVTTPLYPPDNLARKVTDASLRHMQAEFERAASLTHAVLGSQWGHPAGTTTCLPHPNAAATAAAEGEASTSAGAGSAQWTHLFAGHDFWSAHNSFVQLDIALAPGAAPGEDAARLKLWSGWVTSRMPRLTASLARLGLDALAFPRLVPSPHDPDTSASLFLALDLAPVPHGVFEPPSREDISGVLQAFVDGVHKGEDGRKWRYWTRGMYVTFSTCKRKRVPDHAKEF